MIKVLFVCLGNICRSPLAEGVFKNHVLEAGLEDKFEVDSAGTSGWHIGELPDPRSIEVAEKNGIVLESRGRKANAKDFETFDYIIAMDKDNYHDLKILNEHSHIENGQLHLMRDFDPIGKGEDVPDPYYGGADGFDYVFDLLNRSSEQLLSKIRSDHKI